MAQYRVTNSHSTIFGPSKRHAVAKSGIGPLGLDYETLCGLRKWSASNLIGIKETMRIVDCTPCTAILKSFHPRAWRQVKKDEPEEV